jgi:molybdopterin-containing oxidoreductase family iron-sulfur binding subunit
VARIEAKKEDRKIRDGDILTACQQACPTEAIVFGDLNDAESQVAKLKLEPLGYHVLDELGVQPRTKYLGRAKNPNPGLGGMG